MTDIIQVREFCLSLPEATESFPFDDQTLVFKVMGKIFAIIPLDEEKESVALKSTEEVARKIRERYDSNVILAPHLNKKYWSRIRLQREIPSALVEQLIKHSYCCVVKKLPKYLIKEYPQLLSVDDEAIDF